MSRNFELLQNLGKEQDIFEAERESAMAAPSPTPVVPMAAVELAPLQLKMDESQRDELAKVVQRLFLVPGADAAHTVVVAATESGSGCTWTCARMAEMLASQITASVCVVDANLTAPGLHLQFQTENFRGLSDALREPESIRKFAGQVSRENLWLVSSGADSANWQNLLSSDRMRIRLAELRREFDYVIIDAPALNTANHGIVLGHASDGIVLVIKANASRREIARKAVQELESAQVRILGAVLNQRSFPIPQGIYNKL